jgi:hypothetical protein
MAQSLLYCYEGKFWVYLSQIDVHLSVVIRALHVLSLDESLNPLLDDDGRGLEALVQLLYHLQKSSVLTYSIQRGNVSY